jgi:hypothetical protein
LSTTIDSVFESVSPPRTNVRVILCVKAMNYAPDWG